MYQRILGFAIVPLLALSNPVHAALEEVTFQAQVWDQNAPTHPNVGSLSGYFFFDTSQVTGGLRPVFQVPGVPPGDRGTVDVSFGAGPSGQETVTYLDGSVRSIPLTRGFGLSGDFLGPVCGNFDDCFYKLGQVLTLDQFNAAPDPWALITNGMTGSFFGFIPDVQPFGLQGVGRFEVNSVPEPATLTLFALGLAGAALMSRRKKKLTAA